MLKTSRILRADVPIGGMLAIAKKVADANGLEFKQEARHGSIVIPIKATLSTRFKWMMNDPTLTVLDRYSEVEINARIFNGGKTLAKVPFQGTTPEEFEAQLSQALASFKGMVGKAVTSLKPLLDELLKYEADFKVLEERKAALYAAGLTAVSEAYS